jgi:hypothetical protein
MRRPSQLTFRRLIWAASHMAMLGLISQAVNAQITPQPTNTIIRNQSTSNPIEGGPGPSQGGSTVSNSSCSNSALDPIKYSTGETIGRLNYIIYDDCHAIKNLHLRFEVTKELTAKHDNVVKNCHASQVIKELNTTKGIYIQFNAFSRDAPHAMIQYIFAVHGTKITPHIQYAHAPGYHFATPDNIDHDWQRDYQNSYDDLVLAKPNSLAKGFVLYVDLNTDDKGYVIGATFTVEEPDGTKHGQPVPKAGLFPVRISEFQTNIVSTNRNYVDFARDGAGTLSYSTTGTLLVEGGDYEHCAAASGDFKNGTCETSNASYGELSGCGTPLTQSVTVK